MERERERERQRDRERERERDPNPNHKSHYMHLYAKTVCTGKHVQHTIKVVSP